ncbi:MAG: glycosyltransferase [Bacteroidales bacterium]|nr:glycosyltransferase [Bacteroidales bacterium]MDT8430285.1 glycosyltransferase [Bacteroidales bacterium]
MPAALLIFATLVIILYSGCMLWYYISFKRYHELPLHNAKPLFRVVSVILPIRNEEANLRMLVHDLLVQDYGTGNCEIIFVDDHSTDRSFTMLGQVCREHTHFRLIRLQDGMTGKKHAIAAGIEAASGEWIIQTDADCRLPANFISGHVQYARAGADLVAGPVIVRTGKSVWGSMESLEHFGLTATSMAAAAAGRPVMCSGASLSYSKKFYLEVAPGLFAIPHASGDDVFLLAAAKKRKKNILFPTVPGMVVTTGPAEGPVAFLRQRIRWGSKARYYRDADMLLLALLVWFANVTLTGLLAASLFVNGVVWLFFPALALKSFSEYLLLNKVAARLRLRHLMVLFPAAALFYYFYITFAGMLSMLGSFSWKGRRYSSQGCL